MSTSSSSAFAPSVAVAADKPRLDPRLVASLIAVYLIWSSTYLALRIAVLELPPLLMTSMRFVAAGLIMLAVARRRGAAWPTARQWLITAPVGLLLFVGGNGFTAIAEQTVPSGGAAVVCATMPLWLGVLSAVGGERPSRREWLSLVIGFAGVVVLMGGPTLAGKPLHIALLVASPIAWSLGSIYARRIARAAPPNAVLSSAMPMVSGGIMLGIGGAISGDRLPVHASAHAWLALIYLVVFGSLVAFTAYSWLLRNARPVIATSYAYVNPGLAVLVGAALYGEQLGWTTLVANVLIIGGVFLALGRRGASAH